MGSHYGVGGATENSQASAQRRALTNLLAEYWDEANLGLLAIEGMTEGQRLRQWSDGDGQGWWRWGERNVLACRSKHILQHQSTDRNAA